MDTTLAQGKQSYDWAFELMIQSTASYIHSVLRQMEITLDRFRALMEEVGEVHIATMDDHPIGFFWIERRDNTMHIHGICVDPSYRNQGLGQRMMEDIASRCDESIHRIELGVEVDNAIAIHVYEKQGYRIVHTMDDVGFYIMRKDLTLHGVS
jgi:ribosomal protein S18 acetylase RimI-like enzyme